MQFDFRYSTGARCGSVCVKESFVKESLIKVPFGWILGQSYRFSARVLHVP